MSEFQKADEEVPLSSFDGVDPQVVLAATMLDEAQRQNPLWLWYGGENDSLSFGRWQNSPTQAPYLRLDLACATSNEGQAFADILAERRRQVEVKGWTPEHDDGHKEAQLALAGAAYAAFAAGIYAGARSEISRRHMAILSFAQQLWPFEGLVSEHSAKTSRAMLVRAAALLVAEIDRLDRAAAHA